MHEAPAPAFSIILSVQPRHHVQVACQGPTILTILAQLMMMIMLFFFITGCPNVSTIMNSRNGDGRCKRRKVLVLALVGTAPGEFAAVLHL